MARSNHQENGRASGFRLQTSAYANRRDSSPVFHSRFDLSNARVHNAFHHHTDIIPPSPSGFDVKPRGSLTIPRTRFISKSLTQLPVIKTEDIASSLQHMPASSLHDISTGGHQINVLKQSYFSHFSRSSISLPGAMTQVHKSRTIGTGLNSNPVVGVPREELKKKRRRFSSDDDPNRLAMKISLPCPGGCCYCAFTNLLGPVRVYVTRADKPKKEPLLLRFKDGNGNPVIPVSRKSDVRGLVYDPICHNLHPRVRSQRSMLQVKKVKPTVKPAGEGKNR